MNSVVHQQRRLRLFASVFVCLASPAWAQDITAVPAKKMAPEQCPGDCIQISVRNLVQQTEALRLRRRGGNWQTFTFAPNMGLRFRCTVCEGSMEARLPDDDDSILITPGTEYEIKYSAADRHVLLLPGGR